MIVSRARRLLAIASIPFALVLLGLLPVKVPTGDDFRTPPGTSARPVAAIFDGVTVTQQFPSTGAAISAISLQLATYQRVNAGTATLAVQGYRNGQWNNLATQ